MEAAQQFREAVRIGVGVDPGPVVLDGKLRRFPTKPNGRDEAGWCVGFADGIAAGAFGDWRSGISETWCARPEGNLTESEREKRQLTFAALAEARDAEGKQRHAKAAEKAALLWNKAGAAKPDHSYLKTKGVAPNGLRHIGENLVVPVRINGALASLQFIGPNGTKKFLTGGAVAGGYFSIGKPAGVVVIAEGFATGATIHAATGHAVAVAFNAGNLDAVARAIRAKLPDARIVIAADDDHATEGNPGLRAAQEAAGAVGGVVALPAFNRAAGEAGTDWNDLAALHGADAVKLAFNAVLSAPPVAAKTAGTAETATGIRQFEKEPPRPLRRPVAGAEPFPLAALGPVLEPAARAITDRVQCPDAISGMSVLAAAALAVQGHADIVHPTAKRARPVSLFLLSIGATGERKSAADAEALAPIREREAELRQEYDEALPGYTNSKRAYDAAKAHAEKAAKGDFAETKAALDALGPEPEAPLLPFMRASEPTFEGLCRLYAKGRPSLGLFSDEGGSFVGGHAMQAESKLRTITGLSSLWDGSPLSRVRAGDGASVLAGRRLSAHLMAQPGVAAALLSDPVSQDQGFLSRLLVSAPASTAGARLYREEAPGTASALGAYHRHILSILRRPEPMADGKTNELAPRRVELDPQARTLWIDLYDATERQLGAGGAFEPIRGFGNKLAENALRLAAVLALVENIDCAMIERRHVEGAALLADHFATEAMRLWDAGAASPEILQAERLLNWLRQTWPEALIGLSAIYKFGPNTLREQAQAKRAVDVLADHGWIERIEGKHTVGGKPVREAWRIIRETA